jgi:hypothetical protein
MKIKTGRTVIFPVVFIGVRLFIPHLKEEHWLRVFENKSSEKDLCA